MRDANIKYEFHLLIRLVCITYTTGARLQLVSVSYLSGCMPNFNDINLFLRVLVMDDLRWSQHSSCGSQWKKCVLRTVYPKKYAHGFCFAVLCCGYTLTDFPISIRLTLLALWQSNDCTSASKATLMNMDKYFMWMHYERLHNHNKANHNKTVCIFVGTYCTYLTQ